MKLFGFEFKKISNTKKRKFNAARVDRLTSDWVADNIKTNADIKRSLKTLRARCRDLAKNNNHFKKFLSMAKKHVIGHAGIQLNMAVEDAPGKNDDFANSLIEREFYNWGRRGVCDVTGKLSWIDCQELFVSTFFCDGEAVVRLVRNWRRNKYGFALQFIDSELLDVDHSETLKNGKIIMGVRLDEWEKPVEYFFTALDNVNDGQNEYFFRKKVSIPAEDVVHAFITEFVGQVRGIPRGAAAILAVNMLNGYAEAELVAARAAACKGGYYINKNPDFMADSTGASGELYEEITPGVNRLLPPNVEYHEVNPTHPNGNYANYTKSILREIASGLDVSYNSLANDLEGVNYSSMRSGALEERDGWRMYQRFVIESFCDPVFSAWLRSSLETGALSPLPIAKYEKFNAATWIPRRWTWVDPEADIKANLLLLKNNLTTPQAILAEYGRDIEDLYSEIQRAKSLSEKYGLKSVVGDAVDSST